MNTVTMYIRTPTETYIKHMNAALSIYIVHGTWSQHNIVWERNDVSLSHRRSPCKRLNGMIIIFSRHKCYTVYPHWMSYSIILKIKKYCIHFLFKYNSIFCMLIVVFRFGWILIISFSCTLCTNNSKDT